MSSKKIDQLFRDKLDSYEVAPGEKAWARLQGKMRPASKTPPLWMQIAAAVLLLLVGGWFLLKEESSTNAVEETLADQVELKEQERTKQEEKSKVVIPANPPGEEQPAVAKNTNEASTEPAMVLKRNKAPRPASIEVASAEKQPQKEAPVAIDELEKVEANTPAGVPDLALPANMQPDDMETQIAAATETKAPAQEVKITYIADDDDRFLEPVRELLDSDKQKDKKSGFSKLVASARNISGGDLLADIRESKDDLFNGNLRLNREEKVKTQNK